MSSRDDAAAVCRVVVCRGCCCGTTAKHPDTDHEGQLARLMSLPAEFTALAVSGCLGRCDDGNNIVVIPSRRGRMLGGRPEWFGWMLRLELTEAVARWVTDGGPGIAQIPDILSAHRISPPAPRQPVIDVIIAQAA